MRDVLTRVRAELGQDAVILYTKKYRAGGLWGILGRERIEVLAGADVRIPADVPVPGREPPAPPPTRPAAAPASTTAEDERLRRLEDRIAALAEAVGRLAARSEPGEESQPKAVVRERLLEADVEADTASRVIAVSKGAPGDGSAAADALEAVARAIPVSGEIELAEGRQKIVALIGPTGVGKTTTIAKLAARLGLLAQRKVALLTIDTYRIAAVDQLHTYAEIMDVPLQVATDHKTLVKAIDKAADADLVLIDTAGRSQKNELHLGELRSCLEGVNAEVHLVLSATTKERDQYDVVERFGVVPIDRYVLSKMDETNSFGFILNLVDRYPRPISYVTTGQRVPDDIEVADPVALARRIVGELAPAVRS
jgi:flagellar biosynthesis protein FlhF